MTKKDDDRAIGFLRLEHSGDQGKDLDCAIAADEWGHGFGADADRVIVDFAFR